MIGELEDELEYEFGEFEAPQPTPPPIVIPTPIWVVTGRPFQVLGRFVLNAASLTADHVAIIEGIACHVVAVSGTTTAVTAIVLQGHADSLGSLDVNFALGKRRAATAQTRLTSAINRLRPGLAATIQFAAQSSGNQEPIASGTSPACRALNRRVEVFLISEPPAAPPPGIAECVAQCLRDREMKLGRPMTAQERFRVERACQAQCRGVPV